ncbi:MAG: hypothetical protein K0S33_2455 [Bacteroidetes bacterium]|jgi:hypothetical protein|nr:hypothetical protein [Bacteroidota bacterium]
MKATRYIHVFFLSVLLHFAYSTAACECPELPRLNKEYAETYQLIFKGAVKTVGTCNKVNKAHFIVHELFKGSSPKEIDVYFDCTGDCAMSFNPGETWIIYANYAQLGKPDISFCSRSRKQVDNEVQVQANFIPSDLSFGQELEWLQTNLDAQAFLETNNNADFSHKNELPTPEKAIVLVAISFAGMLILYFVIRKFMK